MIRKEIDRKRDKIWKKRTRRVIKEIKRESDWLIDLKNVFFQCRVNNNGINIGYW